MITAAIVASVRLKITLDNPDEPVYKNLTQKDKENILSTDRGRKTLPDIWGYALYAPGRPSKRAQRDVLKSLGVDVGEVGTLWEDEPETGSGRRKGHLPGRKDLLENLEPGNTVIVAAPSCLGVGAADAEWFLKELEAKGVSLITSAGTLHAGPGGDTSLFLAAFKSWQNVTHVRKSRNKPKKRGRKQRTEIET